MLGVDPSSYDSEVPRKNVSLGPVETELLRVVHALHDDRFTDSARHQWTRKLLASELLGPPGGRQARAAGSDTGLAR